MSYHTTISVKFACGTRANIQQRLTDLAKGYIRDQTGHRSKVTRDGETYVSGIAWHVYANTTAHVVRVKVYRSYQAETYRYLDANLDSPHQRIADAHRFEGPGPTEKQLKAITDIYGVANVTIFQVDPNA